jgi:hypothetical protein
MRPTGAQVSLTASGFFICVSCLLSANSTIAEASQAKPLHLYVDSSSPLGMGNLSRYQKDVMPLHSFFVIVF